MSLTTCTTEGMAHVIAGMDLSPGDEIITSDEEHPGLLGALGAAREIHGVAVREVPFAEVAEAVGPKTVLVAVSHVGWVSGSLAPAELAGLDIPVLLDGAQGVGAVPVDVAALGCAAYSGAGQKWLCGPDGSGMLYLTPAFRETLAVPRRGYGNLAEANLGLDADPARGRAALRLAGDVGRGHRLRARLDRTAQLGGLERGPRARPNARRSSCAEMLAERRASTGAPRGPRRSSRSPARTPPAERLLLAEAGDRGAQHPRPALAAGLRGRLEQRGGPGAAGGDARPVSESRRGPRLAGLAVLIVAAAVMNTVRLAQNGYANIFYSAGVRSMADSWHNFLFVSFDPGGLVSVDKPPLALWVQALSARIFGFHPLSLLLPEALMGVAAVPSST